MTGRLTLLLTSPRIASGLLTREAWRALDAADVVLGVDGEPQLEALRESDVPVIVPDDTAPMKLGRDQIGRAHV